MCATRICADAVSPSSVVSMPLVCQAFYALWWHRVCFRTRAGPCTPVTRAPVDEPRLYTVSTRRTQNQCTCGEINLSPACRFGRLAGGGCGTGPIPCCIICCGVGGMGRCCCMIGGGAPGVRPRTLGECCCCACGGGGGPKLLLAQAFIAIITRIWPVVAVRLHDDELLLVVSCVGTSYYVTFECCSILICIRVMYGQY
jgi:hypothetical protein